MAARYKLWYNQVARPDLLTKLQLKNVHQVPRIEQISVSASTNVTTSQLNHPVPAAFALELITGRTAQLTRVRKGNARYKVRQGFLEGAKVNLRGEDMWNFLDRLVTQVMPRIPDFNGLSSKGCAPPRIWHRLRGFGCTGWRFGHPPTSTTPRHHRSPPPPHTRPSPPSVAAQVSLFPYHRFDGNGNYALGIRDWGLFLELDSQHSNLSNVRART